MAGEGPQTTALRRVPIFIFLAVFSRPALSNSPLRAAKLSEGTLSCEEVTNSLWVNQVAILQMMENVSDASCDSEQAGKLEAFLRPTLQQAVETVEAGHARRLQQAVETVEAGHARRLQQAVETVEGGHARRLQQAVETVEAGLERRLQQAVETVEASHERRLQQVLEAVTNQINTTAQDMLTRVAQLRQEMDRFLGAREPQQGPTYAEVTPYFATIPHNDTTPSLCSGDKFLVGSVGSLAVVQDGNYANHTHCSWNITLPIKAPVKLTWEYFVVEYGSSCQYDWVQVNDLSNGNTNVYGNKLCGGAIPRWMLNMVLPPTGNILVTFHSDRSKTFKGFKLNYQLVPHGTPT